MMHRHTGKCDDAPHAAGRWDPGQSGMTSGRINHHDYGHVDEADIAYRAQKADN